MTSTSLQNKKRFNVLLAQALKKQWIYFTITAVITVFSMVILSVLQFADVYADYDIAESMSYALIIANALCLLFSFFTVPRLFKETFKKQQCDIYFSLPVKREEYFCANFISGVISNIFIYIICVITIVIQSFYYPKSFVKDAKTLVIFCIAMLFSTILTYSVFTLCTVVSGKRIHYILVSLLLLISATYAVNGVIGKIDTIWGVSVENLLNRIVVNPVIMLYSYYYDYNNGISILTIILPIVFIALVFAIGLFCFKHRKAEVAQASLSGKFVPLLLLAVFIASAFFYGDSWGKKYIGIVIGFILCAICGLVYSAVFFKKPYTKQSAIVTACVAVVCAVIAFIPIMPSQFRTFEKNVPAASDVESVELQYEEFELYMDESSKSEKINFKSSDAIEKIVAYNNAICEDEVIDKSKDESNISLLKTMFFDEYFNNSTSGSVRHNMIFTYKLKNGRTVKRYYIVPENVKTEELAAAMTTQDVFDSIEFFNIKENDIMNLSIEEVKLTAKIGDKDELGNVLDYDEYTPRPTKKTLSDFSVLSKPYQKDISEYTSKAKVAAMVDLTDAYYNEDYDWVYSQLIGNSDYYDTTATNKYIIDVYYYDKNITSQDKQDIENLDSKSRASLMDYVDFNDDYTSTGSSIIAEINRLSKSVKHKVFVISSFDKNLCAYIDSLPDSK